MKRGDALTVVTARSPRSLFRTKVYDVASQSMGLDPAQVQAYLQTRAAWAKAAVGGDTAASMTGHWIPTTQEGERVADVFLWVASPHRPGGTSSYTRNGPNDLSVGNAITPVNHLWSLLSIVLLLVSAGLPVWHHSAQTFPRSCPAPLPAPLLGRGHPLQDAHGRAGGKPGDVRPIPTFYRSIASGLNRARSGR